MKLKRILVASGNPGKLRELSQLFMPMGVELVAQSEYDVPEADEPHSTFVENALAKAHNAAKHCDMPILAEDSGICIEALNGAPGVYSARYAGDPKSDERNNAKLLTELEWHENRRAHSVASWCYYVTRTIRNPSSPKRNGEGQSYAHRAVPAVSDTTLYS